MRAYRKVDEPYELKIEGGRLVLVGVGAVLTLVLVFLVGVLVGKGLWGGRPEAATALVPASPATPAEPPKPQYTFYKELTSPDGEVPAVKPEASAPSEPAADTPVSGPLPAAAGSAPVGASPKPAESARVAEAPKPTEAVKPPVAAKPVEAAKPEPKPSPKPAEKAEKPKAEPRMPTPQFTVQVGSFRDKASADDQAKKIAGQGATAQVVSFPVEGRTWYRVQVGRFDTRADAEAHYQKKLRPKGIQGFVTIR